MKIKTKKASRRKWQKAKESKKDLSKTYNEFKEFEGKFYTGAKVGRTNTWNYDQGKWKEKKITPDKWEFHYDVIKRRKGKAPEGSGVPVGTEYHWYILAHQNARKLDANNYTTAMTGVKFKLAHKRFDKDKWSVSEQAQRKKLVKLLQEMIVQLKQKPEVDVVKISNKINPIKPSKGFKNDGEESYRPPLKKIKE